MYVMELSKPGTQYNSQIRLCRGKSKAVLGFNYSILVESLTYNHLNHISMQGEFTLAMYSLEKSRACFQVHLQRLIFELSYFI